LRLKNRIGISSDTFLDTYADMVMREGNYFPDLLLRMADDDEKTCPFLTDSGCEVYPDRPDTCRTFPLEQGILFDGPTGKAREVYAFKPPDFCMGRHESKTWTTETWAEDQEASTYHEMTARWSEVKALFQADPWGIEGPTGTKAKMSLMATYNIDRFRKFVFQSSFLKRYKVKKEILRKLRADETALLKFGFVWIKFFLWGIKSPYIRLR
jgi:Fe-S-cluster containining protein